jgi:Protein of unknown function (DUF3237)
MSNADQPRIGVGRRELLLAAAAAGFGAESARAQPSSPMSSEIPIEAPKAEFVYEAIVDIAAGLDLGVGPLGQRAMVPITGGTFEGPDIRGIVLAGGADRQLVRADGYRLLDALYELQTDDGAIITVRNQVIVSGQPGKRPLSSLQITAPEGKYGWLNRSVHVGTLDSLRPDRAAVLIRVFRLI